MTGVQTCALPISNRAQAALVFSLTPVTAMPDKLTACVGDDALATLAAMGLTQVEVHGIGED